MHFSLEELHKGVSHFLTKTENSGALNPLELPLFWWRHNDGIHREGEKKSPERS